MSKGKQMFEDISKCEYNEFSGKHVLLRLVEGIGYRFNRCMHDVETEHQDYKPTQGHMTIGELTGHIGRLILNVLKVYSDTHAQEKDELTSQDVLELLEQLHIAVKEKETEELDNLCAEKTELFYSINGPLADALTHIGQINTYKRMLSIQSPKGSYYTGKKTK
jgi:hypothetical protein